MMPDHDAKPGPLVVVVTGPVGVGKSATAAALADVLEAADIPNAMIDMDYLRWVSHRPADDPFHSRLGHKNLSAVATNACEVGARVFVLADVVETQADRLRYSDAIPGARVVIARLRVPMTRVVAQLHGRDSGDSLVWSLHRAPELEGIMDAAGIGSASGDFIVSADGETPEAIAQEIARRLDLMP
jgi:adenylylsulfate kinase